MITRFGSLYAGHVDLDNIGLEGTPVNERWLSDEHLATVLDKTEAIVTLMDRLGYDTFWAAEHRFQREGYECIPNLLLLFVHLAHITKRLKFGCGFNVAPMWHPLRLAEDFAVADRLTGGRILFGVGRGYHSRECEVLGAPSTAIDNEANRVLFEDQVEIIFKAFNSRAFSHYSDHYTIPPRIPYRGYELEDVTLVPKPRTVPVECWQPIVSASERAMDFMAKYASRAVSAAAPRLGAPLTKWCTRIATPWPAMDTRRNWALISSSATVSTLLRPSKKPSGGAPLFRGKHENVWPARVCARSQEAEILGLADPSGRARPGSRRSNKQWRPAPGSWGHQR